MMDSNAGRSKILTETGTNELEIITFCLIWQAGESQKISQAHYGINAAKVREIIEIPEKVIHIAHSPPCVQGVFVWREKTIPLVDLCSWFDYQPYAEPGNRKKWTVIVAELNGKMFGFINHGVDKVYRVSWDSIRPPHELIAAAQSITGTVLMQDQLIQMIDFEHIVASIDPTMVLRSMEFQSHGIKTGDHQDKAVLVADDSKVIRDLLAETLRSGGFNISLHTDGRSCWDELEHHKATGQLDQKVLAVVSDIEMPRMDGHNLCLRMREDEAYRKIPLILFSSLINDAMRRKGETVGADDQITKPEIDKLVGRLNVLIDQKNAER